MYPEMRAIQSPAAGAVLGATGVGSAAQTGCVAAMASNPMADATRLVFFINITFSPRSRGCPLL